MNSFAKVFFLSTALTVVTACTDNSQVFSSAAAGPAKQNAAAGTVGYYKVGNPYQVGGLWYIPKEDYNYKEIGISSWYGPDFHNGITANGEVYDMHGLTAAHRTLPLPSIVRVTNLQNNRSLVLRVNDRGPFVNNRVIDVSKRAAQLLGFEDQGTTQVQVEILPEESKKLKEELLAAAGKTSGSAGASLAAEPAAAAREQVAKPKKLGLPPNYPRLANPPPALAATDAPLVASASAATNTTNEYNDWDEDMTQAQAQKTVVADTPKPAAAPQKKPEKKTSAPVKKAPSVKTAATVAPGYYVQVGAFGSLENAEKMRAKVARFGSAVILPVTVNAKTLYRVRLGPDSAKKALETMDRVTANGIADARLVEEKGNIAVGRRLDNAF